MNGGIVEALLLSSSAKHGGNCVSGVRLDTGELIRFVSEDQGTMGALTDWDMRCADGYLCRPYDIVKVPMIGPVPTRHQPENWLIDRNRYWERISTLTPERTAELAPVTTPDKIFGTRGICLTEKFYPDRSLELIEVEDLKLVREPEKKAKATFTYNGVEYRKMSMTDREYYRVPDGTRTGRAVLLLSLPDDDYDGKYFKFVAKIIRVGR